MRNHLQSPIFLRFTVCQFVGNLNNFELVQEFATLKYYLS